MVNNEGRSKFVSLLRVEKGESGVIDVLIRVCEAKCSSIWKSKCHDFHLKTLLAFIPRFDSDYI